MFFNIVMVCFYAVAFLFQYLHHRNDEKKHITKAFTMAGFKVYLCIIRNLVQGFLMIFIPFVAGIVAVIAFMDYFNEVYFIKELLPNYDENIDNITPANQKIYSSCRIGTVLLAIAIYLALTIISLNY